jgi:hypothetical protein
MSPCVLILEDLDSLINDRNRSFFLNQLDGLEGNDGILVIGTTNHFDRLDPGLSTRPSRFDRKFMFDDPDQEERLLYVQYWQRKLKNNKNVPFPDEMAKKVAEATQRFSFAYLKEVFVSSLVLLATWDGDDKPGFEETIMGQIKTLRKQLDKNPDTHFSGISSSRPEIPWRSPQPPKSNITANRLSTNQRNFTINFTEPQREERNIHRLFDGLSSSRANLSDRIFRVEPPSSMNIPGSMPEERPLEFNLQTPSKEFKEMENALRALRS